MTQQPLPLDQFEHVRLIVSSMADCRANRASDSIKRRCEFLRRSLGQSTRRAIERIER